VVVDKGGLLDRPRLVPFAEIEAASRDGDVLRLRLTQAEMDALPTYQPERYVVLPAGWAPPAGFGLPAAAYRQPALIDTAPPRYPAPPSVRGAGSAPESEAPPPETV